MRRTMPLMSARGIDRERIGLTAPDGWWSSPALLKSLEAAGFGLVQMHAPPASVLSDSRQSTSHAASLRRSLDTTELRPVLHAPAGLRAGSPAGDHAFEGLLAYAAEIGATHVVYHACALPDAPESDRRHDNLGARWRSTGAELGVDPLRLDLHLPPGRGTVPWPEIAPLITRTRAPVVLEIHPPYRPRASDALAAFERALGLGPAVARQTAALAGPRTS
jgi:sugar phosphate isomerase/epimerase